MHMVCKVFSRFQINSYFKIIRRKSRCLEYQCGEIVISHQYNIAKFEVILLFKELSYLAISKDN